MSADDVALAMTAESLPISIDHWVLVRRIGSGGMGDVWLARHELAGTLGALKRLARTGEPARGRREGEARALPAGATPAPVHDNALADSLRREHRAVMRLSHPHIVPVFDVGDGHIVTRYIEGGSLARRLHTPLEPTEALRIARVIADALDHAHGRGVVHRDVKPSNILLDERDTPYLCDFGLASFLGEDTPRPAGTPQFMAPEQRRGTVGPAADQYALGRTLLEMLAGTTVPIDPIAALAELPGYLPPALRRAIARATAAEPGDRFPSIAAFAAALAEIETGELGPPARRAAPVRASTPFVWLSGARTVNAAGADVARAELRLRDLAGVLPAAEVDGLLARAGLVDLGFTVWADTGRLGPITEPGLLAAASDVVILLHGWGHTREVWSYIARAIIRDNARAVVLAPDLHGFGDSRFVRTPDPDQAGVCGMMRAIDDWRRLLGLGAIPTALVGHSMAGLALLGRRDVEAGVRVSRIAINPLLAPYDPEVRATLRRQALMTTTFGRIGPLRRAVIRRMGKRVVEVERMTSEAAAMITEQTSRLGAGEIIAVLRALAATPPAGGGGHQRLALIACMDDPWMSRAALDAAIADAGLEEANVHRLPSGGHHPHLEITDHPDWSARNAADIVRVIEAMLLTASEATSSSSPIGFDSTVPISLSSPPA